MNKLERTQGALGGYALRAAQRAAPPLPSPGLPAPTAVLVRPCSAREMRVPKLTLALEMQLCVLLEFSCSKLSVLVPETVSCALASTQCPVMAVARARAGVESSPLVTTEAKEKLGVLDSTPSQITETCQ